jgi:hypothetical protein
MSTLGNTEAPLTRASQTDQTKHPKCWTCRDTGQVWTAELDGSGEYDQACPDCDTPYPQSCPGCPECAEADTEEDPF